MIELTFKVTEANGKPRVLMVRIHDPTRSPPEKKWPWTATVEVDGRPYANPGMDPLDAIESACQHAAILLRGIHGDDVIDPPIEPRPIAPSTPDAPRSD